MGGDAADGAGRRPTISVSVPPQQRGDFFTALARLRRAHGDEPISMSALIVNAVIEQAQSLVDPDTCDARGASLPDQPLTPHVLIVDDDDSIRETLRVILEDAGYAVTKAAEGLSALSLLVNCPYQVVALLDNLMPGLDASELLEALEAGHEGDGAAHRHAFILITASPRRLSPTLAARLARLGAPVARTSKRDDQRRPEAVPDPNDSSSTHWAGVGPLHRQGHHPAPRRDGGGREPARRGRDLLVHASPARSRCPKTSGEPLP